MERRIGENKYGISLSIHHSAQRDARFIRPAALSGGRARSSTAEPAAPASGIGRRMALKPSAHIFQVILPAVNSTMNSRVAGTRLISRAFKVALCHHSALMLSLK